MPCEAEKEMGEERVSWKTSHGDLEKQEPTRVGRADSRQEMGESLGMAQPVECLPKALGLTPSPAQSWSGLCLQSQPLGTKAGGSETQRHPQLHSEFEVHDTQFVEES